MKDLLAKLRLDLYGNMMSQSRAYAQSLNQFAASGSRSFAMLSRAGSYADSKIDSLGTRFAALATGAGTVMAGKNVAHLQTRLTRLAVQAEVSDTKIKSLNEQIYATSQMSDINIDPSQLTSAVEKIVSKTGNLKFAEDNLKNLAYTISATGAAGEDVGAMAADIFEKFSIKDADEMLSTLGMLVNQGKAGAFELRDLASQGERVTAAYARTGRKGTEAVSEMGALLQMARKSTGSPEQAATSLEALMRNLTDSTKAAQLEAKGIQIMDPKIPGQMRSVIDIIKDIVKLTKGDQFKLGNLFDSEGYKAISQVVADFRETGKFTAIDEFKNASRDSQKLLEDSARLAKQADNVAIKIKAAFGQYAINKLSKPLETLSETLNKIDSSKMQGYLENAGKTLMYTAGALVAYKGLKTGFGIYNFLRNPLGALGGKKGGGLASMAAPTPVYVVNAGAMGIGSEAAMMAAGGGAMKVLGRLGGVAAIGYGAYGALNAQNGAELGQGLGTAIGGALGMFAGPLGVAIGTTAGGLLGNYLGGIYDNYQKADTNEEKGEILGEILGKVSGIVLGPLGVLYNGAVNKYFGGKIGSMFDSAPSAPQMLEQSLLNRSESKIVLEINSKDAQVSTRSLKTNSTQNNQTDIDISLGGRNVTW